MIDEKNPQCFATSALRDMEGGDFFNERDPNLVIMHEKPEHRLMIHLKASGKSNRAIAKVCEKSEAWVSQVLRQPWARKRLTEELNRMGQDVADLILEAALVDSIYKVIDIRDKGETDSVQLAAAQSLIDRVRGKAMQTIESRSINVNISAELEDTEKELQLLEEEEERLRKELT